MAQRPAVVIVARHGPRIDASDLSWHLSTPTPYDPPLTYSGWNSSRALGVRIADLLDAREKSFEEEQAAQARHSASEQHGDTAKAFAAGDGSGKRKDSGGVDDGAKRKKRRKHKVVIHTSPFMRCVQTSVAIAAGMAQYQPPSETTGSKAAKRSSGSPILAPIAEPKNDLMHEVARRVLEQKPRYRKAKLRVDAFLGEWLNPGYFDQITPPPPSSLMVMAAKGELMSNEQIERYTPSHPQSKGSGSSLWGGTRRQRNSSNSSIEDMSPLSDALPSTYHSHRDRASSTSSVGSNGSSSGRRSPFRTPQNHGAQSLPAISLPEPAVYHAPVPQYAVSGSDNIPRGYVSHARQSCVNVDYQWDSSRTPQSWGDGGEFGEEWSTMHKRFRSGLNHLVQWYAQHNADDRAEDSLSLDQAEHHDDDEQEDLVIVLVTHGAGCNALIGALTAQPVLLDVGVASLTMAVRKDDAPPLTDEQAELPMIGSRSRRTNVDMGLSAVYDMKLVASSEHLRRGADPARIPKPTTATSRLNHVRDTLPRRSDTSLLSATGPGIDGNWNYHEPGTNSSLGSMRRPSLAHIGVSATTSSIPTRTDFDTSHALHADSLSLLTPPFTPAFTPGLWIPPDSRTPNQEGGGAPEQHEDTLFSKLSETDPSGRASPGHDLVLDFSTSPPDSRPGSSDGPKKDSSTSNDSAEPGKMEKCGGIPPRSLALALTGNFDGVVHNTNLAVNGTDAADNKTGTTTTTTTLPAPLDRKNSLEIPKPKSKTVPPSLSRGLSQHGLWGSKPAATRVERKFAPEPKRRWTLIQE